MLPYLAAAHLLPYLAEADLLPYFAAAIYLAEAYLLSYLDTVHLLPYLAEARLLPYLAEAHLLPTTFYESKPPTCVLSVGIKTTSGGVLHSDGIGGVMPFTGSTPCRAQTFDLVHAAYVCMG